MTKHRIHTKTANETNKTVNPSRNAVADIRKDTQKVLSFLEKTTPSKQTALKISKELGVSTYSVWRSLKELEESGVVTLVPLSTSGKTSSHSFIRLNQKKLRALTKKQRDSK